VERVADEPLEDGVGGDEESAEDDEERHAEREPASDRDRLRRVTPSRKLRPAHVFEDHCERA